jgi:anti-anti-sigma factor
MRAHAKGDLLMETKLKNQGEVTIITIRGPLDIEKTQPFREACLRHLLGRKVIFNMEKTSFVGSTGLQAFLETIRTLSEENQHGLKVVGVQAEFKRIFQNLEIQRLQIHESEENAMSSFVFEVHSS